MFSHVKKPYQISLLPSLCFEFIIVNYRSKDLHGIFLPLSTITESSAILLLSVLLTTCADIVPDTKTTHKSTSSCWNEVQK